MSDCPVLSVTWGRPFYAKRVEKQAQPCCCFAFYGLSLCGVVVAFFSLWRAAQARECGPVATAESTTATVCFEVRGLFWRIGRVDDSCFPKSERGREVSLSDVLWLLRASFSCQSLSTPDKHVWVRQPNPLLDRKRSAKLVCRDGKQRRSNIKFYQGLEATLIGGRTRYEETCRSSAVEPARAGAGDRNQCRWRPAALQPLFCLLTTKVPAGVS